MIILAPFALSWMGVLLISLVSLFVLWMYINFVDVTIKSVLLIGLPLALTAAMDFVYAILGLYLSLPEEWQKLRDTF